jgi:signal transduction histidine kinase
MRSTFERYPVETNPIRPHLARVGTLAAGPWLLATAGVLLFHAAWRWQGDEALFWLPGLGLGIVMVAWLGLRILPVLAIDLLFVRSEAIAEHIVVAAHLNLLHIIIADSLLHTVQIGLSWWLYYQVARGSRWLDDPRSATLFLILVPGGLSAAAAIIQAFYKTHAEFVFMWAAQFWLSRMLGILVVVPVLIVVGTPMLLRMRLVDIELPPAFFGERESTPRLGDRIETAGLTLATSILAVLLLWTHVRNNDAKWILWASCLVLIVWTCVRQGLRGGCIAASITSVVVLVFAQVFDLAPALSAIQTGIQGNLLAFCSSALLVGVSASWIRANEARFRHVIGRIPFVVYSARLPRGIPTVAPSDSAKPQSDSKPDMHIGPSIGKLANVMLVSPAARQVFDCDPDALIGPFELWLRRIVPEDRELVIASLAQLCLQKQPVTCEYRLLPSDEPGAEVEQKPSSRFDIPPMHRWVRDTLTPHYDEDGLVNGWEGLIEDITDQRSLSQNLRKMTNMLQVLVTNLPTGVYFVHGPQGAPLLVNPRARQLLGQREDLSAGLANLSRAFHLHRPDGTEYPWEELPVCKALRLGVTCRTTDIVVHRADGRKIPLITWAAPIDLHNTGKLDAAVWVLDDWSAMQQADMALRESEIRLQQAQRLELIGRLASGTVHDFNNLLMVVMSLAGMAKHELSREHPAWQLMTRIEEAGEQAAHLAGQILTFGKEQPRECQPVDLNAVITQTLKLARSVVPVNIAVETALDPHLPAALGDENQLKQIMMNLCINARDAMMAGGTLTIRTDQVAPPSADGRTWVHLAVEDTGCGMPEDVRLHVFEPFFSTKERGTGLGLAVVQHIVEESDGLIDVHSNPGEGTRFDIWLPHGDAK